MKMGGENSDLIQTLNMTSFATVSFADVGNLQNPPQIMTADLRASSHPSNVFGDKSHTLQRLEDE